ncbi:MAG: argininosuccinate lyase [Anaerolineales bacterium]|jgi:argininosuccinate lyase
MKMWGGRFSEGTDPVAWSFNASIKFDQRLAPQDVRGSIAWAKALEDANVLSSAECQKIQAGLEIIQSEIEDESFEILETDEDIHSAVERRLGEIIGPLAGKLHTGRSRNDQVATDLRLWLLDNLLQLDQKIMNLMVVLLDRAEREIDVILPGFTHLQHAQPVSIAHWWLSYFWPLARDRERFAGLAERTAVLPLGSAALAGTPYPVDRFALAEKLGFSQPCQNSIDGVSDRDFVAEFLFSACLTGIHLSRLCEAVILYASAEFGFFILPERFATGSSIMPQKLNPDVFELGRAKAGTMLGYLTGMLAVLKGLPSAYDKDLQEDKIPLFSSFDILSSTLSVLEGALKDLKLDSSRMSIAVSPELMATDLADYLVDKGVPFREAHRIVGEAARFAAERKHRLDEIGLEDLKTISPNFDESARAVLRSEYSVNRRNTYGGTGIEALKEQIKTARRLIRSE